MHSGWPRGPRGFRGLSLELNPQRRWDVGLSGSLGVELELELCGQRCLPAAKQPRPSSKTQLLLGEPSRHTGALSLEPPTRPSTSFCARGQTASEKDRSARRGACWIRTGVSHSNGAPSLGLGVLLGNLSEGKVKVGDREDTRESESEIQVDVHLREADPQRISGQQRLLGISRAVHH